MNFPDHFFEAFQANTIFDVEHINTENAIQKRVERIIKCFIGRRMIGGTLPKVTHIKLSLEQEQECGEPPAGQGQNILSNKGEF